MNKIVVFDDNAINEIFISNKIKKIDNYDLFFSVIDGYMMVDYTIRNDNTLSNRDINIYELSDSNNNNYVLFKTVELQEYINIYKYFNQTIDNNIIAKFIESYKNILNNISILNDNLIIHFGINMKNVLINSDVNIILSEFNYSLYKENITIQKILNNFEKNKEITYFPIEIFLLYQINSKNVLSIKIIESVCDEYLSSLSFLFKIYSSEFINNYYELCKNYLLDLINININEINNMLIDDKVLSTWDNFSVACIYLELINKIYTKKEKSKYIILCSQLLIKNIHPNYKKRYTIKESQIMYEKILESNISFI